MSTQMNVQCREMILDGNAIAAEITILTINTIKCYFNKFIHNLKALRLPTLKNKYNINRIIE